MHCGEVEIFDMHAAFILWISTNCVRFVVLNVNKNHIIYHMRRDWIAWALIQTYGWSHTATTPPTNFNMAKQKPRGWTCANCVKGSINIILIKSRRISIGFFWCYLSASALLEPRGKLYHIKTYPFVWLFFSDSSGDS